MFSIASKRSLTTLAVAAGLLIAAAPASAHPQRAVSDGTSNTVFFAAVPDRAPLSVACDGIGAWL